MRIKTMVQTAAVISLAVVAGLLGVGGTWALWNASAPAQMGTVQAADFSVTVNGSPLASQGVTATARPETSGAALTPKTPVYSIIAITNATNASGPFSLRTVLGQPTTSNTPAALASNLTIQTASMPASNKCADASYTSTPTATTITKGATASLCLRMSLPQNAPGTLTQTTATVAVPVTATQIQ
ncbi:SipW-dependent-type signal peptide-containing protein [Citricoccus sp. NPDC079358]|uniref:SipW-dependent-type signal peptide-containing protein n=1 Tax=Citricoccus sp. NPDC079358 TaxID=3154653 RepID=UPI00344C10A1